MLMECRRYLLVFFILEDNVIRRRVVTLNYQLGGITSHLSSSVILRVDPDLIVKRKNTAIQGKYRNSLG